MNEIVPFGKYKDKPVELMTADRQYCEWLSQQPWFKERYVNIYNTVIQYNTEPVDTPEHNKIQNRFLNEAFVKRFLKIIWPNRDFNTIKVEFEKRLIDWKGNREFPRMVTPPVDVVINHIGYCPPDMGETWLLGIEIKPTVGDDYPAILRQMRESKAKVLLIRDYTGEASREELIAFFLTARIAVTFLSELD